MINFRENITHAKEFHIVPFSIKIEDKPLIVTVFIIIYLFGVLANAVIITLVYVNDQLHTPMYLLLCNLSIVDICYTTVIVPKLLDLLLSGNNTMTLVECFTQMFAFFWTGSTEDLLLFAMAYDRYVAICKPLHYHLILNRQVCILLISALWLSGCLNAILILISFSNMSFCHSNTIQHILCDSIALTKISCSGMDMFYNVIYVELVIFGFCPFVCTLTSYINIISVILCIKSIAGRRKAFSTCSSHLAVLLIYYVSVALVIMMPPSQYSNFLDQVFTMFYATVAPMINPIIYSLRNKEAKRALLRLMGK